MFTTENAEISDDFWKRRTRLYFSYYKRAFFIKALKYRRFGNDIVQSVSVTFFTVRFDGYFFTIKNYLCTGDYATTVCAIKSTQLKQDRTTRCVFLNTRTYPSLFRKRLNFFVIRKATFRTQKRFHNKQYTPKLKDQPFESERTHFDTGFNNGSIAMHRQTFIFLLPHQTSSINRKINHKNNQPEQSIKSNNQKKQGPATTQSKAPKDKHNKQLRQNAMFF